MNAKEAREKASLVREKNYTTVLASVKSKISTAVETGRVELCVPLGKESGTFDMSRLKEYLEAEGYQMYENTERDLYIYW